MPRLPSGLRLALDASAPFQPTEPLWPIPVGHYFRAAPDPTMPRPYRRDQPLRMGIGVIAAPKTPSEALAHCRLIRIDDDNMTWWKGEYAHEFPLFETLSADDLAAWQEWLAAERTQGFLKSVVDKCQRLAFRAALDQVHRVMEPN